MFGFAFIEAISYEDERCLKYIIVSWIGFESPRSSGYVRRLVFNRILVHISAQDTEFTFSQ